MNTLSKSGTARAQIGVMKKDGILRSLHAPNQETARILRDARKPAKRSTYTKAATIGEFTASLGTSSKRKSNKDD